MHAVSGLTFGDRKNDPFKQQKAECSSSDTIQHRQFYLSFLCLWPACLSWFFVLYHQRPLWRPVYSCSKSKAGVGRSIMLVNFCGRGLVSWENRRMKSLNHDTRHLPRHNSDDKKWQMIRMTMLLCCFIFWLRNNIKSEPYGFAIGYSTGNLWCICFEVNWRAYFGV